MPSFTHSIPNLVATGPIAEILVGPSKLLVDVLTKLGQPVPQPVQAVAMVDTGASGTVITPALVQQLGLKPVGVTQMSTPSTIAPVLAHQYNVGLSFKNGVNVVSVLAIEAPLGGQHIQCLVGRDVLRHGVLTYIGYINQFTLSF